MDNQEPFQTIEYRNGVYQGFINNYKPSGLGLFLDDDSGLYASTWVQGVANGRTAVFISQGKYFYGDWKNNMPDGFNIFRTGDTVLLGNYENGRLIGRFMIVFERQGFVIVVNGKNEINETIQKKYYSTQEQLKSLTNKHFQSMFRPDDYFSFVFFLKHSFCLNGGPLKLQYIEGDLKFGYNRGLGVIFDDDNFIRKVGVLDQNNKLSGLGASYGISIQQGNFDNGNIVRYAAGNRPIQKVRKLFKAQHRKSIFYKNNFVLLNTDFLTGYLQQMLKKLIFKIAQLPLTGRQIPGNETVGQLNDSLQYQPKIKTIDNSQQIYKMKFEIQHPIGKRNGAQISSPFHKHENEMGQYKKLYFTPLSNHQYVEPEGIKFTKSSTNAVFAERQYFLQKNKLSDYRSIHEQPSKRKQERSRGPPRQFVQRGFFEDNQNINNFSFPSNQLPIQDQKLKKKLQEQQLVRQQHQNKLSQARKKQQQLVKQRQKQQQLRQQIQQQIQKQKQKQSELERQRAINQSIEKQMQDMANKYKQFELKSSGSKVTFKKDIQQSHQKQKNSRVLTVQVPVQTSFSEKQQKQDSLNNSNQVYFKKQHFTQKSTSIKSPAIPEIHYNPFLRTFVSSKYPPFDSNAQQVLHRVSTTSNINENKYNQERDQEDSLQKGKKLKLTEFKLPRYLIRQQQSVEIQQPPEPISRKLFTNKKEDSPQKIYKKITNTTYTNTKKVTKHIQQQRIKTKSPGKSYLQMYKTGTTANKQQIKNRSKSPTLKEFSPNPIRKVINSPYSGKSKQHAGKKIIEIERQKTSPEGKKIKTFQRIVKKYHYITQKA